MKKPIVVICFILLSLNSFCQLKCKVLVDYIDKANNFSLYQDYLENNGYEYDKVKGIFNPTYKVGNYVFYNEKMDSYVVLTGKVNRIYSFSVFTSFEQYKSIKNQIRELGYKIHSSDALLVQYFKGRYMFEVHPKGRYDLNGRYVPSQSVTMGFECYEIVYSSNEGIKSMDEFFKGRRK